MCASDVAKALLLSHTRVVALIKAGALPARKWGQLWMLRWSDVEAFAKLARKPGRKPAPDRP